MIYPNYNPTVAPKIIHYGLRFNVGPSYSFDKHSHYGKDMLSCKSTADQTHMLPGHTWQWTNNAFRTQQMGTSTNHHHWRRSWPEPARPRRNR
eukprot:scaffold985_cov573-Prasinococcus_capsulatus_cf.AAC.5